MINSYMCWGRSKGTPKFNSSSQPQIYIVFGDMPFLGCFLQQNSIKFLQLMGVLVLPGVWQEVDQRISGHPTKQLSDSQLKIFKSQEKRSCGRFKDPSHHEAEQFMFLLPSKRRRKNPKLFCGPGRLFSPTFRYTICHGGLGNVTLPAQVPWQTHNLSAFHVFVRPNFQ